MGGWVVAVVVVVAIGPLRLEREMRLRFKVRSPKWRRTSGRRTLLGDHVIVRFASFRFGRSSNVLPIKSGQPSPHIHLFHQLISVPA
jgi:hypothetical protein